MSFPVTFLFLSFFLSSLLFHSDCCAVCYNMPLTAAGCCSCQEHCPESTELLRGRQKTTSGLQLVLCCQLLSRSRQQLRKRCSSWDTPCLQAGSCMMHCWLAQSLASCHPSDWHASGACCIPAIRGLAHIQTAAGRGAGATGWSSSAESLWF